MKYSAEYRLSLALRKLGFEADPTKCQAIDEMQRSVNALPGKHIRFVINHDDNGDWCAESIEPAGIIKFAPRKPFFIQSAYERFAAIGRVTNLEICHNLLR